MTNKEIIKIKDLVFNVQFREQDQDEVRFLSKGLDFDVQQFIEDLSICKPLLDYIFAFLFNDIFKFS